MVRYLIEDNSQLYTVSNGSLVAVSGSLSAAVFRNDGFQDLTGVEALLQTLTTPTLHAWSDNQQVGLIGTIDGTPIPQSITTAVVNLSQSDIDGISEITATYTGAPLAAVKMSGGNWIKFDGTDWVTASDGDGMSMTDFLSVTQQQWADLFDSETTFQARVVLSDSDTLSSMVIVFTQV